MGIEQYRGRRAVVTGASTGVGAAVVQALLRAGIHVVGLGRRVDLIKDLAIPDGPAHLHYLKCDLTNEKEILKAFSFVSDIKGGVDILVNCARIRIDHDLASGNTSDWKKELDVNVIALSICTREAVKDMRARNYEGYIIHVNSVAAHNPPKASRGMYYATKYAVKALSEGLRKDLLDTKSPIRHTMISQGAVKPPVTCEAYQSAPNRLMLELVPFLEAEDIAELVMFILSQPKRVQIHDIIVNPTGTTS